MLSLLQGLLGQAMQRRPGWSKIVGMQYVHQTRPRAEMAGGKILTVQQQSMSPMLICNATTQCHSQTGSSTANFVGLAAFLIIILCMLFGTSQHTLQIMLL